MENCSMNEQRVQGTTSCEASKEDRLWGLLALCLVKRKRGAVSQQVKVTKFV
jgi:hypothetical protein